MDFLLSLSTFALPGSSFYPFFFSQSVMTPKIITQCPSLCRELMGFDGKYLFRISQTHLTTLGRLLSKEDVIIAMNFLAYFQLIGAF